jgi:hypothetical protein
MKPVALLSISLKPSRRLLLIQSLAHIVAATSVLAQCGSIVAGRVPAAPDRVFAGARGAESAGGGPGRCAATATSQQSALTVRRCEADVHPHTLVFVPDRAAVPAGSAVCDP